MSQYLRFVGGLLLENDWTANLEDAFSAHLSDMEQAVATGTHESLVTESEREFCGCRSCWMREILAFLMPKIIAAYQTGAIRVVTE